MKRTQDLRSLVRLALPPWFAAKVVTMLAMAASVRSATGALTWDGLAASFRHWDSISYLDIAANGYPAQLDYHDAFLPGYPLLVRAASLLTVSGVLGAVLVSSIAELVALMAIAALVRRERDVPTARFAVWAMALAPLGFFFTGAYTESCFIAAAAVSLELARGGHMRGAAVAAAAACAVRLTGIVLLPVLLVELLRRRRPLREAAWLAVIPLPLLLFAAYMQLRIGDPLAFLHAQALPSFGETAAWPWDGLRLTWTTAATSIDPGNRSIFQREVVFGLLGLVVVAAGWVDSRFPRSLALYCTLVWLMAVSLTFWRSVPRYDLALFPAVIVAADLTTRARRARPVLVLVGAVGLALGSWVFARGGWIG